MFGTGPIASLPIAGWPAVPVIAAATTSDTRALKPGGPAPHSYTKYYAPPHSIVKKKRAAMRQLKELYLEARKEIPQALQIGLLPIELYSRGRASSTLPVAARVDFEKFAADMASIRVLISAYEAEMARRDDAERKRVKRRKDEESLIILLMEIL